MKVLRELVADQPQSNKGDTITECVWKINENIKTVSNALGLTNVATIRTERSNKNVFLSTLLAEIQTKINNLIFEAYPSSDVFTTFMHPGEIVKYDGRFKADVSPKDIYDFFIKVNDVMKDLDELTARALEEA